MSRLHTTPSSQSDARSSAGERALAGVGQAPACLFCADLESGAVLGELGAVAALADGFPVAEGHALVIPKRHVQNLFDLTEAEARDAWRLLKILKERIAGADPAVDGFNVGVNVGDAAGQTVPHVHIHLIPRRQGDTPAPRGGVRGVIPHRMAY